jgi:aminoglycoside phosphotransferase family enzyme
LTSNEPATEGPSEVTLENKVRFLQRPEAFPDKTLRVETIETHMSWVFLTERYVYKLKKPVRYDFLDFSTCEARRRDCEAEIRLNRRLAAGVYLQTIPLTCDSCGNLSLEGSGKTVDWLVKMRRLPKERMLDQVIARGSVTTTEIRSVAKKLSLFYKDQPPVSIRPSVYRQRFEAKVRSTLDELTEPKWRLPANLITWISTAQLDFLEHHAEHFDSRVRAKRIIEAHGDLRAEHICLEPEPVAIDCLEFKREFRLLDPADELAFLAMDCERLGAQWIRELVFAIYSEITGDRPPEALRDFYTSYRACLRAKIAIWHLKEPDVENDWKWRRLARELIQIGERYAQRFS